MLGSPKKIDKKKLYYERQLVARCIKGDKRAWDEFVEKYKRLIYSSILRTFKLVGYNNTEETASDLFQSVFALLLKDSCSKLRSFKWRNGCSLASWLAVVSRNLAYDHIRKILSHKEIMDSLIKESDVRKGIFRGQDTPDELFLNDLENEDNAGILKEALKKLPEEDLRILNLVYLRGFPLTRVAKLIDKSADAVYAQKKRALDKLKEIIRGAK